MNDQVEKQVSEVEDEMNTLSTVTSRLITVIDKLEGRLSSVLKPLTPTNETNSEATAMVILVPLAGTIRKEVAAVSGLVVKVENILQRLGI